VILHSIKVEKFKGLSEIDLKLSSINYLVGGNNAGKSSVLQAVHTAVTAAQTSVEYQRKIINESQLKYSPTGHFEDIGHKYPLENNANGNRSVITFKGESDEGEASSYKVQLYRGRNAGAGVERSGQYIGFGSHIIKSVPPFSIYVPGLAGISHFEEFRSHNVVIKKIAGGEANSVLRNVLLLIKNENKLPELKKYLCRVFSGFDIEILFNEKKDQYIDVTVKTNITSGFKPIDLMGTGVLQSIQLFAYTILFKPTLLLLDEPDAHLHPSNQHIIIDTLETITEETNTRILLATHSRHMINAAGDKAKVFWIKEGKVKSEGNIDRVKLLNELGALDSADELGKEVVLLTEDHDKALMKKLLKQMDIDETKVGLVSYNGVANHSVAIQVVKDLGVSIEKVIVHRDRDFLTDEEVKRWENAVINAKAKPFVTPGSDTEMLFIDVEHLSALSEKSPDEIKGMLNTIAEEFEVEFRKKFKDKRRDHNRKYQDGGSPKTEELCPDNIRIKKEHILGKILLSKVRSESKRLIGMQIDPLKRSKVVVAKDLKVIH
jgi:ABC-type branched-subunit amino acid transport system ATPase component